MRATLLRDLASSYLVPLFSGSRLPAHGERSSARQTPVAFRGPCEIQFKVDRTDNYRLKLCRSQKFETRAGNRVAEIKVVQAFVEELKEIQSGLDKSYSGDLKQNLSRKVVARSISRGKTQRTLVVLLDQMALWATRLYEGKPIVAAVGVGRGTSPNAEDFKNICREDFGSVLSNGFDTILVCGSGGKVLSHEALPHPRAASIPSFAPYRQAAIAAWARGGRVALVLNRLGEILVFRNQELVFARRSGQWHFLTHAPLIKQMGYIESKLRLAVYESSLDASFARAGACIGLISRKHAGEWHRIAPSAGDHVGSNTSAKARAITSMLKGRPFQNLDRRFRQELLAIDGATLLDHRGQVLAIGSILRIRGGSTGGGRLAAAKALGKLGLGVKVSQDGRIQGFHNSSTPSFSLM